MQLFPNSVPAETNQITMLRFSALLSTSILLLFLFVACLGREPAEPIPARFKEVVSIPAPNGFARVARDSGSFAHWLGKRNLKKDNLVKLFDGSFKRDQTGHYAVLDMSVGNKDLQQCADAIIRMRAEYLFEMGYYDSIHFLSTSMQRLRYTDWCRGTRYRLKGNRLQAYNAGSQSGYTQQSLLQWLDFVFTYAGSYSLQKQLRPIRNGSIILPGDVIVEGGFPGHAMMVMDIVSNEKGEQQMMLAQSYMPAQEMHIVRNPHAAQISPWYSITHASPLETPDWRFQKLQFYRW
jgi:hypothetical protein